MPGRTVSYIDLGAQHKEIKQVILQGVGNVLDSGQFILGSEVEKFEKSFAMLCGTKYAISVANGTDALVLSLKALNIGPGDEVITAPNSFLASASSIVLAGATPVFADVSDDFNINPVEIRKMITSRTKAIMPVHLTGRPAQMEEINKIAKEHNLKVIEDAAQAVGAKLNGKPVGSWGHLGSFSLHPLKNLGAAGDGGVITTDDDQLYEYLIKARNHGLRNRDECDLVTLNSRLDAMQAIILNAKMPLLESWNTRRREIAAYYTEKLYGLVTTPVEREGEHAVYHTYIIQTEQRDALKQFLTDNGVDTKIHYPIPIHRQRAFAFLNYDEGSFQVTEQQVKHILSLPIYPQLKDRDLQYICKMITSFFK